MYAYGSRVGFWRVMRQFADRHLPLTVFAVGRALELNPEAAQAMGNAGHEVAAHAYRWIDYTDVPEDVEREHVALCVQAIESLTGTRPVGWYTGRISQNTRRLVVEEGGFLYDSDAYDDDWPYWIDVGERQQLVIPYTFDSNDMKFHLSPGFVTGEDFYRYLRDAFDTLYSEGVDSPRMMSVGLHCRTIGRPGRAAALARFLDYVQSHDAVWICRRREIAEHWRAEHQAHDPQISSRPGT